MSWKIVKADEYSGAGRWRLLDADGNDIYMPTKIDERLTDYHPVCGATKQDVVQKTIDYLELACLTNKRLIEQLKDKSNNPAASERTKP